MDNKISEQKKANRLLYMVIVGILCVTAIIIGLTAALGRRGHNQVPGTSGPTPSKPGTTAPVTTPSTTPPEDQTPTDGKLVLLAPLTGTVAKKHSDDMMVYSMTMNDYRIHQGYMPVPPERWRRCGKTP